MLGLRRTVAFAFLLAWLGATATPCPPVALPDLAARGPVASALHGGQARGPQVAPATRDSEPRLVAVCPCGCDEHAPAAPGLHGLDAALPPAPPSATRPRATWPLRHPSVSALAPLSRSIEHVPLSG